MIFHGKNRRDQHLPHNFEGQVLSFDVFGGILSIRKTCWPKECLRIGFWLISGEKQKKNEFPKKMDMFSKDEAEDGERIHKRLPSNRMLIIHSS